MGLTLVTGGHGFLGRHVVERLRHQGDVLAPSRAELDLADVDAVRAYWAAHRPTRLVHLAAFARGLGGHLAARERSFLDNEAVIRGPLVVALEQGVESVFFAGTVAEYGWPYQCLPLREDDVYTGPPHAGESFYAQAKRLAPQYLDAIRDRHGTAVTHGLLTNLYGPGDRFDQDGGHVVAAMFCKVAAARVAGTDVTLWGRPDSTRDFLYVGDAASVIARVHTRDLGLLNIASGREEDMARLAYSIRTALRHHHSVQWTGDMVGIPHRSVDISRLRAEIPGYYPLALWDGVHATAREWDRARV